ncbi:MAG TPA: hypothetical protein VEL31_16780 [Ktedonobacteraceae bacterium]|nr:hypothetical protein [Ktedonobacteraceae bacterium]
MGNLSPLRAMSLIEYIGPATRILGLYQSYWASKNWEIRPLLQPETTGAFGQPHYFW